ncbi:MAG: hypothetical protein HUN04_25605 [Desulfobacter sp.]|nr:MAG: hypothetical protein HUN04_25605 [Desulfobacter sp.]
MNSNSQKKPIVIGCHRLKVRAQGQGPLTHPPETLEKSMMAGFDLSIEVEFLFPYINAVAEDSRLYDNPSRVSFRLGQVVCVLYPQKGVASPITDIEDARAFLNRLLEFLNEINRRKERIIPWHRRFRQTNMIRILKLLPMTNCKACGFNTCTAFAAMLGKQQALPEQCPFIRPPVREKADFPVHDQEGNLVSTIPVDVDYSGNRSALAAANRQIRELEDRLARHAEARQARQKQANDGLSTPLSRREIQVLEMVARGATNMDISRSLSLSPHTVKSHITHIFNKLGVNSRTQASVWASRHEFV